MSIRLEEKPFELDGKVYMLRCNMAVLDALQDAHGGDFGEVMNLPARQGIVEVLAAMLNDYAEDIKSCESMSVFCKCLEMRTLADVPAWLGRQAY